MGLFDGKPGGFFDRANQWMTPERAIAFQGIGMGLSQMANGQTPNLSPAYAALQKRQENTALREGLQSSGVMDRFTPEQQRLIASMPPQLAQQILTREAFKAPAERRIIDGADGYKYYEDGSRVLPGVQVQPDPGYRLLTPEEVSAVPTLDPNKAYQIGPNNQITAVGGGGVTVNLGNDGVQYPPLPAGQDYVRDEQGKVMTFEDPQTGRSLPQIVNIPGGPQAAAAAEAAAKAEVAEEQAALGDEQTSRAATVVLEDIGRLRDKVKEAPWWSPATGFGAETAAGISGTNAADAAALSKTIRANIGFDRLQQMREASPTGGALGSVSERELGTLEAVLGSLENSQSEEQYLENLDRLEEIYTEIYRKAAAYPNAAEFGFSDEGQTGAPSGGVPEGVDPGLWEHMTDEEKALFQ